MNEKISEGIKVSVLIPVYNVENYIEKCVRSLFSQTMQEGIEFIFVDDNSPDNSINIVKDILLEYPYRRKQVRILRHERNKGLAVARLTGLCAAKGDYVVHCDSDDWVAEDMYERMFMEGKKVNADIVLCNYFIETSLKTFVHRLYFRRSKEDFILDIISGKTSGFLWNRMFKRYFYMSSMYHADSGITYFEDIAVTIPAHIDCNVIAYIEHPLYHYNQTVSTSMSSDYSESSLNSMISVLEKLQLQYDQQNYPKYNKYLNRRLEKIRMLYGTSLKNYHPKRWRELFCDKVNLRYCSTIHRISFYLLKYKLDKINYFFIFICKIFNIRSWGFYFIESYNLINK